MKAVQRVFLVVGVCLVGQTAVGQEASSVENAKWKIQDLYFQYGFNVRNSQPGQLGNFEKLAPNSVILQRDRSGFSRSNYGFSEQVSTASVLAGINLSDYDIGTNKPRHQLRLGFTYISDGGIADSYSRVIRKPYDVLTSQQTNAVLYIDSVERQNLYMNYQSDQIRLDASYLLRFTAGGRFSFFTGIGTTAGVSLNSNTAVSYYSWRTAETRDNSGNSYYGTGYASGEYEYEVLQNNTSYGFSGYIPLGIDFQIARRNVLLSRLHLYLESRPGINFLVIPELETISRVQMANSVGIRLSL